MKNENTILEASTPVKQEGYDEGYIGALEELMKQLNAGDDDNMPIDNGMPGNPQFPDPRLTLPRKKSNSSKGGSSGQSPKNKTIDIDTGEEINPEKQQQQEQSQQTSQEAQDAASSAAKAAQEAQEAADKAQSEAESSGSESKQQKAAKAQKAAEKAKKAAEKAQKAADKAQKLAEKGKQQAAQEAANDAKEAAQEAQAAANEMKHGNAVDDMSSSEAASDAQKSAEAARKDANDAKEAADKAAQSGDETIANTAKKAAEKAEKAAQEAEKAAQQAQKAADNGKLEKAQEAAKKAREAADMAKCAKNTAERTSELTDTDKTHNDDWSGGEMSERDKKADPEDLEGDLYDCTEYVKGVIEEFSKKITGPVGDFLEKCKDSIKDIKELKNEKNKPAVKAYARKAKNAWDVDFKKLIDTYVTDCVQERKHEKKKTWARPNRRQGVVKDGDVLRRGELPKQDKIDITMTFYIDISYSMVGDPVINAFKAAYAYSDFIKKENQDEAVVGEFDYTFWAFNERFHKIVGKKIPAASGGNVDFNQILDYIESHSMNDMINVIITDAQFTINPHKCVEIIKKTEGLFIVIANNQKNVSEFEEMKNALQEKFEYLIADEDFTFHMPK